MILILKKKKRKKHQHLLQREIVISELYDPRHNKTGFLPMLIVQFLFYV